MKTFKNFTAAIAADGITVTKGQVRNGFYSDANSNIDYQLVNNNSSSHNTPAITKKTWICDGPVKYLEKDLERLDRIRRIVVGDQFHKELKSVEKRVRNRTGSYTLRQFEVEKLTNGVGLLGDFVITDYSIDEETQMARVTWTNIEYL
jgi:hypothetical protein